MCWVLVSQGTSLRVSMACTQFCLPLCWLHLKLGFLHDRTCLSQTHKKVLQLRICLLWVQRDHHWYFYCGKFQKCLKGKLWFDFVICPQMIYTLKGRSPAYRAVVGGTGSLGREAWLQEVISWEGPWGILYPLPSLSLSEIGNLCHRLQSHESISSSESRE